MINENYENFKENYYSIFQSERKKEQAQEQRSDLISVSHLLRALGQGPMCWFPYHKPARVIFFQYLSGLWEV